jgi:polyhydroxyalkanoate synthesis regulator phasin
MAQPLDVKRLLATGKQITDTGRQLGTDLVEQGRLATDQIAAVVEELVNRGGRERIEDLRETVRGEVQPLRILASLQLAGVGKNAHGAHQGRGEA